MKTRIIHHVNCDFTYEVIETQILMNDKVVSSTFSNVKNI